MAAASDRAAACCRYDPQHKRITLTLHVQPGAASSAITGLHGDALKVRIAAPAVENKANAAATAFLSKALGVRSTHIQILHGSRGRRKVIAISEADEDLHARVRAVIDNILR